MRLGILADDLTGANAIAAIFTGLSVPIRVAVGLAEAERAAASPDELLTIDLESRFLAPQEAARRSARGAELLKATGADLIFKQSDSTLHGNLAAELTAAGIVFGGPTVPFAPACPHQGRFTVGGYHLLQEPGDPPRLRCHIPSLLRSQGAESDLIPLDMVEGEMSRLTGLLASASHPITVVDACQPWHLTNLVKAAFQAGCRVLGGSVGLAAALAGWLPVRDPSRADRPVLVVVGSHSPTSMAQIRSAAAGGMRLVAVDPAAALTGAPAGETATAVCTALEQGQSTVLAAASTPESVVVFRQKAEQLGLDQAEAAGRMTRFLGAVVRSVLTGPALLSGLVVGGGETAFAVLHDALQVTSFDVQLEAFPGCTLVTAQNGICKGLPVITKAGGWGDAGGLFQAVDLLQKWKCQQRII